jgi:hypothetical protein
MIQSFAAGWSRPENAPQWMNYVTVISDLDPKFIDPYDLAIMAVGEKGGRPDMVFEIVKRAVQNNPHHYLIPYNAAFYAFHETGDIPTAKFYNRLAQKDPNAPEYIPRQYAFFEKEQGRYRLAFETYLRNYLEVLARGSDYMGDVQALIYHTNLSRAIDHWMSNVIQSEVKKYYEEHGEYPTVEQLDRGGRFAGVELPDWPMIYGLLEAIKQGTYELPGNPAVFNAVVTDILRNSVKKWDHLPQGPYSTVPPYYRGYVVWPEYDKLMSENRIVLSRAEAMFRTWQMIKSIEERAKAWSGEHGGQTPPDLASFAPDLAGQNDPFGGRWTWDPASGRAGTTSFKDLTAEDIPKVF